MSLKFNPKIRIIGSTSPLKTGKTGLLLRTYSKTTAVGEAFSKFTSWVSKSTAKLRLPIHSLNMVQTALRQRDWEKLEEIANDNFEALYIPSIHIPETSERGYRGSEKGYRALQNEKKDLNDSESKRWFVPTLTCSPLKWAIRMGDEEAIERLLKLGVRGTAKTFAETINLAKHYKNIQKQESEQTEPDARLIEECERELTRYKNILTLLLTSNGESLFHSGDIYFKKYIDSIRYYINELDGNPNIYIVKKSLYFLSLRPWQNIEKRPIAWERFMCLKLLSGGLRHKSRQSTLASESS